MCAVSELERLLQGSLTIEELRKRIAALEIENEQLRRDAGRWRLLADIRKDTISMFHIMQGE
jgi:hypothetical protein